MEYQLSTICGNTASKTFFLLFLFIQISIFPPSIRSCETITTWKGTIITIIYEQKLEISTYTYTDINEDRYNYFDRSVLLIFPRSSIIWILMSITIISIVYITYMNIQIFLIYSFRIVLLELLQWNDFHIDINKYWSWKNFDALNIFFC